VTKATARRMVAAVAIHEAGHAGVAWVFGFRLLSVSIHPAITVVDWNTPTSRDAQLRDLTGAVLAFHLAGRAAQRRAGLDFWAVWGETSAVLNCSPPMSPGRAPRLPNSSGRRETGVERMMAAPRFWRAVTRLAAELVFCRSMDEETAERRLGL
jgi:hypothetical protein